MTSTDERHRYICELYSSGWSAIEIGREMGLSRSQVHRIVAAGWPDDEDELADDDEDGEDDNRYADEDEGPVLVEPVTFCGEEWVILPQGRGEERKRVRVERWTDARGQQCSELTFYRHRSRLIEQGIASGVYDYHRDARAFDAELDRQRAEYEQRVTRLRSRSRPPHHPSGG